MLTAEKIKTIPALASLPDDAIKALETLSANDENAVISAKIKEIHDAYDADIKSVTGLEKTPGTKTYDHMKTVLGQYKTQAETGAAEWKAKADQLEAAKADLEKKIKEGGNDAALKAQLEAMNTAIGDEKKRAADLQKLVGEEKKRAEEAIAEAHRENDRLVVGMEFERGLAGIKFSDAIPKEVRATFVENAKQTILSRYTPDTIERDGAKVVVFRDKDGFVVNNPENLQNPYTPGEMLLKEIAPIVDQGKPGAGTKPGGKATNGVTMTGNWRSRSEAVRAFQDHLAEQGITAGTPKHDEEMQRLYTENDLSALPVK